MLLIIAKDSEERQRSLKTALKQEKAPVSFFDHENFTLFLQEAETLPFLSSSKALVMQEIDQLEQGAFELLLSYVGKPNSWISLYLTAASLPPQSKLIKKMDQVIRIKEEKIWEKEKRLTNWVMEEAESLGVVITHAAAQVFVKTVDASSLKMELEKLACFVGEKKEISVDAIDALCLPAPHETLWQLGDAIFSMQLVQALQIGKGLLEEGVVFFSLLAHLRTQFHTMLNILSTLQKEGIGAISRDFPYLKGAFLDKKISTAKKYGMDRLQSGLIYLFETEVKAKNSAVEPALLLEILLVKCVHDSLSATQCAWTY